MNPLSDARGAWPTSRERRHLRLLAVAVGVLLLGELPFLATSEGTIYLFVDPAEISDTPSWYAAFNGIGIGLWFCGAACTWLVASLPPVERRARNALVRLGLASLLLGLDDLWRLHEELSNATGLPEAVVLPVYLFPVAWMVVRSLRFLRPEILLVLVAISAFAASLGLDLVVEELLGVPFARGAQIEEHAKFVGLFAWTIVLVAASRRTILDVAHRPSPHRQVQPTGVGAGQESRE